MATLRGARLLLSSIRFPHAHRFPLTSFLLYSSDESTQMNNTTSYVLEATHRGVPWRGD